MVDQVKFIGGGQGNPAEKLSKSYFYNTVHTTVRDLTFGGNAALSEKAGNFLKTAIKAIVVTAFTAGIYPTVALIGYAFSRVSGSTAYQAKVSDAVQASKRVLLVEELQIPAAKMLAKGDVTEAQASNMITQGLGYAMAAMALLKGDINAASKALTGIQAEKAAYDSTVKKAASEVRTQVFAKIDLSPKAQEGAVVGVNGYTQAIEAAIEDLKNNADFNELNDAHKAAFVRSYRQALINEMYADIASRFAIEDANLRQVALGGDAAKVGDIFDNVANAVNAYSEKVAASFVEKTIAADNDFKVDADHVKKAVVAELKALGHDALERIGKSNEATRKTLAKVKKEEELDPTFAAKQEDVKKKDEAIRTSRREAATIAASFNGRNHVLSQIARVFNIPAADIKADMSKDTIAAKMDEHIKAQKKVLEERIEQVKTDRAALSADHAKLRDELFVALQSAVDANDQASVTTALDTIAAFISRQVTLQNAKQTALNWLNGRKDVIDQFEKDQVKTLELTVNGKENVEGLEEKKTRALQALTTVDDRIEFDTKYAKVKDLVAAEKALTEARDAIAHSPKTARTEVADETQVLVDAAMKELNVTAKKKEDTAEEAARKVLVANGLRDVNVPAPAANPAGAGAQAGGAQAPQGPVDLTQLSNETLAGSLAKVTVQRDALKREVDAETLAYQALDRRQQDATANLAINQALLTQLQTQLAQLTQALAAGQQVGQQVMNVRRDIAQVQADIDAANPAAVQAAYDALVPKDARLQNAERAYADFTAEFVRRQAAPAQQQQPANQANDFDLGGNAFDLNANGNNFTL